MVRTLALVLSAVCTACGGTLPAQAAERPGDVDATLAGFQSARITALDVGPDARIVAAGKFQGYPLDHPWVRAYLPSGRPAPNFGQNGTVRLDDDRRVVVDVIVQPDGRVLVAQGTDPFPDPAAPHLIRRLTAGGAPDPTFGGGRPIEPDFGAGYTRLSDLVLQPDGRIVAVGASAESSVGPVVFVVARYLADGSPDPSFGSNGATQLSTGAPDANPTLTLQPGGGLILTASRGGAPVIARLSPGGQPDGSFGGGGLAPIEYEQPARASEVYPGYGPTAPVVLPDGRIRVALALSGPGKDSYRMGLIGLTKDGHPDRSFGRRGLALGPRPGVTRSGESVETAVRDARGGILVTGGFWGGDEFAFDSYAVIRRFRADGSPDLSFGNRGVAHGVLPGSGYPVFQQRLAFLDDDTLVAAEHTFDGKYGFWGPATLRTLHAGYDDDPPAIALRVRGCRSIGVRIRDLSGMEEVVVRTGRRIVRRTARKRFRVRLASGGRRVRLKATDLAENSSTKRVRLPSC